MLRLLHLRDRGIAGLPAGRRGFFCSFTLQGTQAGQILAAAVFLPLAAYATNPAYGIRESASTYLWINVLCNVVAVAVIPFVGGLSDRVGRRRVFVLGALGSGVLMYAYLYFISVQNTVMMFVTAIVMWGLIYQGYNAVYPAFFQELFPTRNRVSAVAIASQIGVAITGFIPTLEGVIAPARSNVVVIVGTTVLGFCVLAAIGAWTAREPHRIHLNDLGERHAVPVPREEFDRIRAAA